MKAVSVKKLVFAALFAALICVSTISIRIPTPGTGGRITPGGAPVILAGVFLDPATAFLAAGIGSCMADLSGGYFIYVPITFFIKGFVAWGTGLVYRRAISKGKSRKIAVVLGGVIDIFLVALGYFICETILYGSGASLASVPSNLLQGTGGLVIAEVLYPLLERPLGIVAEWDAEGTEV